MLNLQELTDLEMRIKIIDELLNNELKDMCIRTWRSDDSIEDFLIDKHDVGMKQAVLIAISNILMDRYHHKIKQVRKQLLDEYK